MYQLTCPILLVIFCGLILIPSTQSFINNHCLKQPKLDKLIENFESFSLPKYSRIDKYNKLQAGKGFGAVEEEANQEERVAASTQRKTKLKYGQQIGFDPIAQQHEWERRYKAYIGKSGKDVCIMSWDGFQQLGRGAVLANYDQAEVNGSLNEDSQFGGITSIYVPRDKWTGVAPDGTSANDQDLEHILSRIDTYDPTKEFIVIFQGAGLMGADIVKPNIDPPTVFKQYQTESGTRGPAVIDV
eukprot:CAMPEP_0117754586 /NCGR_PEP_ID=MMETSP0947-20121206/12912_1 /TAXON_ID=44440 /ORGANISM="Chattonella subsalsa, Strain CCMP2191" /LENGTH=242 /DNA_ID=CAMNT_0005573693 /DNA_START=93 /DNA_END=821 /DNA_ORIENTATION=+